jgi:hypothetical protein
MIRSLMATVLLALLPGLAGCLTHQYPRAYGDLREDQPWIGPGERAKAAISAWSDIAGNGDIWLEWLDGHGKVAAVARTVVEDSHNYLCRTGERQMMSEDSRPWPRGLLSVPRSSVSAPRYCLPGDSVWLAEVQKEHPEFQDMISVVSPIWTIVSVRPVVLVAGPGQIQYGDDPGLGVYQPMNLHIAKRTYFTLGRGLAYGTQVPFSEEPRWFSPDMSGPPQAAEHVDENHRRIPVLWGSLLLTREGSRWIVTAETGK